MTNSFLVQMSIVCLVPRDRKAARMSLRYVTGLEYIKVLQTPPTPQSALVPHGSSSHWHTHQKHAAGMHRNILENIDVAFLTVILSTEIILQIR